MQYMIPDFRRDRQAAGTSFSLALRDEMTMSSRCGTRAGSFRPGSTSRSTRRREIRARTVSGRRGSNRGYKPKRRVPPAGRARPCRGRGSERRRARCRRSPRAVRVRGDQPSRTAWPGARRSRVSSVPDPAFRSRTRAPSCGRAREERNLRRGVQEARQHVARQRSRRVSRAGRRSERRVARLAIRTAARVTTARPAR